jgi:hypothetical protein
MHLTEEFMLKNWIFAATALLATAGTSEAHPLDSPDIIYIDGVACNSACQSYMAWSRQILSTPKQSQLRQFPKRSTNAEVHRTPGARAGRLKLTAQARVEKQDVSVPQEMPRAEIVAEQTRDEAPAKSNAQPKEIGDVVVTSKTRTIQEQIAAATALAEHLTVATALESSDKEVSSLSVTDDLLVALVMVRPEIQSLSALTGKEIAIDGHSALNGNVQSAIVEAGAVEVQLSDSQTKAIDRLIGGEVPAAVLTLVSPEAADWFPDIAGFNIFRVPLSLAH